MRGKRSTTKQKIIEGDPGRVGPKVLEKRLAAEPRPDLGLPQCPPHITGRAKRMWELWTQQLDVMRMNKQPDAAALEGACTAYARAVDADIRIRKEGMIIETSFGPKKHPAVDISFRAWDKVLRFCQEFGFTPLSRSRFGPVDNKPLEDEEATQDLMDRLDDKRESRLPASHRTQ